MPFQDGVGRTINNQHEWMFARNQQRNWETLNQLISLRTQVLDVEFLGHNQGSWQFEFSVEHAEVYDTDLMGLINECAGVPMLTGLTETLTTQYSLVTQGTDQNIWFESINK